MNMPCVLCDSQRRSPIIRHFTGFLHRFPGLRHSREVGVVVVVRLATPAGSQDAASATSQAGKAAGVGQDRVVNFAPEVAGAAIRVCNCCEELRGEVGPLVFLDAPEEGDGGVGSVVNRVSVVGVGVNYVDVGLGLKPVQDRWCGPFDESFVNVVLLASVVV